MNSRDEGFINRIEGNLVYVSLDDGFVLPVLDNEVAVIAKEEDKFNKDPEAKPTTIAKKVEVVEKLNYPFDQGVYLIIDKQENRVSYSVFNYTSVCFCGGLFSKPNNLSNLSEWIGLEKIEIEANEIKAIFSELYEHATQRNEILFEGFFFSKVHHIHQNPIVKVFKIKDLMMKGKQMSLRGFDRPIWLFNTNEKEQKISAESIREQLLGGNSKELVQNIIKSEIFESEIEFDLHAEILFPDKTTRPEKDKLLIYQLDYFQKVLDESITKGIDKIFFIHGVGNGVLRKEIHSKLGKHPHIKTFKDARKERFGFGATEVIIK